jgi:hypothetical protein
MGDYALIVFWTNGSPKYGMRTKAVPIAGTKFNGNLMSGISALIHESSIQRGLRQASL